MSEQVLEQAVEKYIGKLTIQHNHGTYVLRDAVWHGYDKDDRYNKSGDNGFVVGKIVSGGSTSRLFHATHTTWAEVDSEHRQDYCPLSRIYPRRLYENREFRLDGFEINCCTCG